MTMLRNVLLIGLFLSIIGYFGWMTLVRFANPALTETKILLETWQGLIPMIIFGLLVAIVEYLRTR